MREAGRSPGFSMIPAISPYAKLACLKAVDLLYHAFIS